MSAPKPEVEATPFRQHSWRILSSSDSECRDCGMKRKHVGYSGRRSLFEFSDHRGVIPTKHGKLPRGCKP